MRPLLRRIPILRYLAACVSPLGSRCTTRFCRVVVATALAAAVLTAIGIGGTDRGVIRGPRLASVTPPRMLHPLGRLEIRLPGVSSISAKRDVVAVAAERPGKCGKVLLWSPRSRRKSTIPAGCYGNAGYNSIDDLVLAPTLVAWVFGWGDVNSGSDCLMIRAVSAEKIGRAITRKGHSCNVQYGGDVFGGRTLPAFESVANGGTSAAAGKSLTSLEAGAHGIVYSVESYCNALSSCPTAADVSRHVERSLLVSAGGAERLIAGRGVRIVSAAANVVAAVRADSVDVRDLGTRARRKVTDGPVRAARLGRAKLFILRPRGLLDTYDLHSGQRIGAQELSTSGNNTPVQLEDADDVFVVYVSDHQIHVRRTRDQRDVVLALPRKARMLHAQIEPAGLYYSYNIGGKDALGRVGFVARTPVVAAFTAHG